MYPILPRLYEVSANATKEEREAMYRAYVTKIVELNPWNFLPLGVKKKWYNFKREHPLTKLGA
jgi:hypothetical protein